MKLCTPSILLLQAFSGFVVCRLPGAPPDEGDVSDLFPSFSIAIGLNHHAFVLPYLLGWLENVDYPKYSVVLNFYFTGNDAAYDQVTWWRTRAQHIFRDIILRKDVDNWMEHALRSARISRQQRFLLLTGDTLPFDAKMLRSLLRHKDVLTMPHFHPVPYQNATNFNSVLFEEAKKIEPPFLNIPFFFNLEHQDVAYATFDNQNLLNYEGSPDPFDVLQNSLDRMDINAFAVSDNFYGYWLDDKLKPSKQALLLRYLIADRIADQLATYSFTSSIVRPDSSKHHKMGVDEIFVINLERRQDRKNKVEEIMSTLGIEYTLWKATDGKNLNPNEHITYLPNYLDPFYKRPMKNGEVGCFLSHYNIWKFQVQNNLKRIIILEDDVRFLPFAVEVFEDTLADCNKYGDEYDLIYLGRKKNSKEAEFWVDKYRHLTTVTYSYWTLGYMLTLEGAKKLVNAQPLSQLLPVDEFLPIMSGTQPNKEFSSKFSAAGTLKTAAFFPVIIVPQRYTFEDGYVSDTESSEIVTFTRPQHNEL